MLPGDPGGHNYFFQGEVTPELILIRKWGRVFEVEGTACANTWSHESSVGFRSDDEFLGAPRV